MQFGSCIRMSVKMLVKLSTLQGRTDYVSHLWTKLLFILRCQVILRMLGVINQLCQCSAPYTYHKSWFSKPRDLHFGVNHVRAIARPLSINFRKLQLTWWYNDASFQTSSVHLWDGAGCGCAGGSVTHIRTLCRHAAGLMESRPPCTLPQFTHLQGD